VLHALLMQISGYGIRLHNRAEFKTGPSLSIGVAGRSDAAEIRPGSGGLAPIAQTTPMELLSSMAVLKCACRRDKGMRSASFWMKSARGSVAYLGDDLTDERLSLSWHPRPKHPVRPHGAKPSCPVDQAPEELREFLTLWLQAVVGGRFAQGQSLLVLNECV